MYKRQKQHVGALGEVKSRAEELLNEQRKSQAETRRLNQLLGRSDQRGRWGEVQLANVLEASGLRQNIDYQLQVSSTNDAGRAQRPDCVVNMPNGSRVAIDAKFPFDAFEAALASENPEERKALELKHAKDLRAHVKTLRDKAYWESITPAPEFVACFVPSDVAVSVAFDADPTLCLLYTSNEVGHLRQPIQVLISNALSAGVPFGKNLELDPQHSGLHGIKTGVDALLNKLVLRLRSVVADPPGPSSQSRIVSGDGAAVTQGAKVLGRIEREAGGAAQSPYRPAMHDGPMGCLLYTSRCV